MRKERILAATRPTSSLFIPVTCILFSLGITVRATSSGGEKIIVVQVAGLIARRIACWVGPGDEVVRGRRFGLIRFGSRLDVYLPAAAEIEVGPGRKVRAGESIIGRMP